MTSSLLTTVLAVTSLIYLSASVHGLEDANRLEIVEIPAEYNKPAEQCIVSHGEIECTHIVLELMLKTAMANYLERNPHRKTQAPWFDPFKHVTYQRTERCTGTALDLLSNVDVRESLSFCINNYGNSSARYVPSSPGQMYKDMCAENARIRSEIINK